MDFSEIIFILLAVVLLFGPEKLPEIARGFGQATRYMRNATDDIKREIMNPSENLDITNNIKNEISEVKQSIDELTGSVKREL